MVVVSAGVLVSDCCHAIAACADDDCTSYECTACSKLCTASESLGEYHDRLEAPKRERERLKDAVIKAVRLELDRKMLPRTVEEAVRALNKHEAEHGK